MFNNLLDRHLYLQMIIDVLIKRPCLINIRTSVFPFCLLLLEISEMNIINEYYLLFSI